MCHRDGQSGLRISVIARSESEGAQSVGQGTKALAVKADGRGMDVTSEDSQRLVIEEAVNKLGSTRVGVATPAFNVHSYRQTFRLPIGKNCWLSTWTAPFKTTQAADLAHVTPRRPRADPIIL